MIPIHRKTYSSQPLLEALNNDSVKTKLINNNTLNKNRFKVIIQEEGRLSPIQKPYSKHLRHRSEYINPLHNNNLNFELTDNSILRTIEEADSIITKFRDHISKRRSGLRHEWEVRSEESCERNMNGRGLGLYKNNV